MKIDDAVGLDRSITQAPIPATVERRTGRAAFLSFETARQQSARGALRDDRGSCCRRDRFAVILVA